MGITPQEWLKQAEYDMETAEYMFDGGRYFYTVFMCHLSIEKALKGLYQERLKEIPPKVHNLIYLIEKINLKLPNILYNVVYTLNRISVPTRYPEDLHRILNDYNMGKTKELLSQSIEVLQWLKAKL